MAVTHSIRLIVAVTLFCFSSAYFGIEPKGKDCFCQLSGNIDECGCTVDVVDCFNNKKIYPRLSSLLQKDYFKFYKVNLNRKCPFWADDSRCAIRYCHVEPCLEENIPPGLKGHHMKESLLEEDMSVKYMESVQAGDCDEVDHDDELGYLNTTISAAAYEEFARWKEHDDALDNFCDINSDDSEAQYVDLSLNPERYTGYKGKSAHRIWNSIYKENCFRPKNVLSSYIASSKLNGMCLEKRVFYRVISGLHSSINIHLCSNYLLSEKETLSFETAGRWGPNLQEFLQRFDPEKTHGEGPQWLRNLYFLYLLELRALLKAAPYLEREEYYTGNDQEDEDVRRAIKNILNVVRSFPYHFNETVMFTGGKQAQKLKEEFRQHFRNISHIMDCVGCDKCKLWGKLQIHGLGTALKILFSGKFDAMDPSGADLSHMAKSQFQLHRSEIVALLNAFGRLSTSIFEIEHFREMMR